MAIRLTGLCVVISACSVDTESPVALPIGPPIAASTTLASTTTDQATTTSAEVIDMTTTVAVVTAAPTTQATVDPRPLAIEVLAMIPVMRENGDGYDRELFEHWITIGGCSTRESVLIRDSLSPAQVDPFGCRVVAGDWRSPYDGAVWETPSDVDIDHVVALKEAWDSGAWAWTPQRRRAFANDLSDVRTLRAVTDEVNQSKGDKDPSNWMPPLQSAWCPYLADWVAIKVRWGLSMDESEAGRIRNLLDRQCVGTRIEPWSPV